MSNNSEIVNVTIHLIVSTFIQYFFNQCLIEKILTRSRYSKNNKVFRGQDKINFSRQCVSKNIKISNICVFILRFKNFIILSKNVVTQRFHCT